ncbi:phosphopyruvate hydratase [Methanolobus halotolerans]|uniref:Enolase n=1 Tax=Methanolobus halotolerans TaxID=2052935 RepID=A0A4E0Q327_9EURY|nr:phosphopyruvate hydratase [Methanolobus halotolerans]TGC07419.1 phosphopyruvate hydratase [Methanolobus halotolerans]
MNTTIRKIHAREILDSRGNPTVEVDIVLQDGTSTRAAVPSGASTGKYEAFELRDRDMKRYGGKGVLTAVANVNGQIANALTGIDASNQELIDRTMIELDGTPNKEKLGANAILGVSMAVARAVSKATGVQLYEYLSPSKQYLLPAPMMNVLNGGVHAQWQGADFQEYMIVPLGASDFQAALQWGAETYHTLQSILKKRGYPTAIGDEGGFAPKVASNEEPLELITLAIEEAGYRPGKDIGISLDPASSGFFQDGKYELKREQRSLTSEEMAAYYEMLVGKYSIISIEDGLAEEDWQGWKLLTKRLGERIELIGDDIFVTSPELVKRGIEEGTANSVLIKLNQIGTVTETLSTMNLAKSAGWGLNISHRSGETIDSFISDFTVATRAGKLKTGAPCRGERVEKYNQLLRIEEELGDKAIYAGRRAFVRG